MKDSDVFELQRGDSLRVFGVDEPCTFSSLARPDRLDRIAVVVHPKEREPYLVLVDTSNVRMVTLRGRSA